MEQLLGFLNDSSPFLIYAALGVGAAIENIIPPIPADTFVLLGGFWTARHGAVFLVTWTAHVLSALAVYGASYQCGVPFFETRIGRYRYLLDPAQLAAVRRFYDRWGTEAIFCTRFLPGLRAVVPVFAGVSRHRPALVVAPIAAASAIWYGGIVWTGAFAGRNLERILTLQFRFNVTLTAITISLLVPIAVWWVRSGGTRARDGSEGQDQP